MVKYISYANFFFPIKYDLSLLSLPEGILELVNWQNHNGLKTMLDNMYQRFHLLFWGQWYLNRPQISDCSKTWTRWVCPLCDWLCDLTDSLQELGNGVGGTLLAHSRLVIIMALADIPTAIRVTLWQLENDTWGLRNASNGTASWLMAYNQQLTHTRCYTYIF